MRRAIVFAGAAAAVAVATVIACSFPDPAFAPDTQFPDGEFVPAEGGTSTSSGSSSGGGNTIDGPGNLAETGSPDGNPCVGDPDCDCDGDKDLSRACDGGDCDDRNPKVHSKKGFNNDSPLERAGDWNCDGTIETQYDAGVKCARTLLAGDNAAGYTATCKAEGFAVERSALKCNEQAVWVECGWNGTTVTPACNQARQENKVVQCK